MERIQAEKEIRAITDKIVREYQPEQIILFGSWAWGEPHEWSDADLFIIKDTSEEPLERMREVKRIIFGCDMATDIVVYTPIQTDRRMKMGDPFVRKILTDGKTLYAKL